MIGYATTTTTTSYIAFLTEEQMKEAAFKYNESDESEVTMLGELNSGTTSAPYPWIGRTNDYPWLGF